MFLEAQSPVCKMNQKELRQKHHLESFLEESHLIDCVCVCVSGPSGLRDSPGLNQSSGNEKTKT